MDVKEAVALAKDYIATLFVSEGARDIGLEEVIFDENRQSWAITIGFTRSWDDRLTDQIAGHRPGRTYKVVRINDGNRRILSLENRDP